MRLPAVHRSGVGRPGRARRRQDRSTGRSSRGGVGPHRTARGRCGRTSSPPRSCGRATGAGLEPDELTAMFAETRPEAIEDMRQAADDLRAEVAGETVTFVVNRNINVSNVCIVGCAFCGFGQGKRSPDAYQHPTARSSSAASSRRSTTARRRSACSPASTRTGRSRTTSSGCASSRTPPRSPRRAYSPMEIAHMCDLSGRPPDEVFARLREAGLDSTPGTAAEVLHDGVRERISPNKLPVAGAAALPDAAAVRRTRGRARSSCSRRARAQRSLRPGRRCPPRRRRSRWGNERAVAAGEAAVGDLVQRGCSRFWRMSSFKPSVSSARPMLARAFSTSAERRPGRWRSASPCVTSSHHLGAALAPDPNEEPVLAVEQLGQREVVPALCRRAGAHRIAEAEPARLGAIDDDDEDPSRRAA